MPKHPPRTAAMPIHDWTRVDAGVWHNFHVGWVVSLQHVLNNGSLPAEYYSLAERKSCTEVETSELRDDIAREVAAYALKRRTLVIRHSSDDRIVALIEIVSPGNKASKHAMCSLVEKATEALYRGYHLLLIDLFPPGPRDPQGIHGAIWGEISDQPYTAPPDKPLTLAAYSAGPVKTAYVEPVAVGDRLIDMPLFLGPEEYVTVPLEATYESAWHGVPRRWRSVLELRRDEREE